MGRMARSYSVAILSMINISVLLLLSTLTESVAGASEDGGYARVVNNHFVRMSPRAGSRFLAVDDEDALKKGENCDPVSNNICPGIPAKNNTQLLQCCKTHCRDVLTDRNNCGECDNKCRFGQLCCKGVCTAVAYDVNNCGKCGKVCKAGVRCEYGSCGYA